MCHGAGGMASHVKFGARTGGATVFLGLILLCLSVLFGNSLPVILQVISSEILGMMMLLAGSELALSSYDRSFSRADFRIMTITAGISLWNSGIALLAGIIMTQFSSTQYKTKENKNNAY